MRLLAALTLIVSGNHLVNGAGKSVRLLGVNRSGLEYACVQGWGFSDGPVDAASIAAMKTWAINAVRVPLNEDCWLGINGVKAQYSGAAYRTFVKGFVARLNAAGLTAILDLHWNAAGSQRATGQQQMPDADHSPAFWSSVARTFRGNRNVIFDLYSLHGRENRGLVDRVARELVELVGEDVARNGRIAGRERRRLAVEIDSLEPRRLDVLELDVVAAEPRAEPADEKQRLRVRAGDADRRDVRDVGPERREQRAPPRRARPRDVGDGRAVEESGEIAVRVRQVIPLGRVDDQAIDRRRRAARTPARPTPARRASAGRRGGRR